MSNDIKNKKKIIFHMYRTIKRRFEVGNIKLVTAINTIGTIISLFIVLWIFSVVSEFETRPNIENIPLYFSQELLRGVGSHGLISSLIMAIYILGSQNEKQRGYYLCFTLASLWLIFTTKSIWPSLLLGCCIGLFLPEKDCLLSSSKKFPDL
jgi:hypothetical protein